MSLYTDLIEAGAQIESHESDLFFKADEKFIPILNASKFADSWDVFFNDIDGQRWIEVPFAYDPWWENRTKG
jgi:hypothetical protein